MNPLLEQTSQRLTDCINTAKEQFARMTTEAWTNKPGGNWSRKEILGHLVDSAANNHIRLVRAQLAEKTYVSFAYEQEFFVKSQQYQNSDLEGLINLWAAYNSHLSHVIQNIEPGKLHVMCIIGKNEPVRLSYLIKDYVDHLEHHLRQISTQ